MVSASASRDRPAVTGKSQRDLHDRWLDVAAAHDPADVERLLAALGHGNIGQVEERVTWFRSRPADPRVAAGLEALIASPPAPAFTKSSAAGLWKTICATLARRRELTNAADANAIPHVTTTSLSSFPSNCLIVIERR